jgi:hypothetical protein
MPNPSREKADAASTIQFLRGTSRSDRETAVAISRATAASDHRYNHTRDNLAPSMSAAVNLRH